MVAALRHHWPEYLMEAAGLGLFMVSACAFVILLENPASPIRHAIPAPTVRRVLVGAAMGMTAIVITYSPLGQQSGAHLNPAVTLTFWRLGKMAGWDALFYGSAQFAGGLAGILLMASLFGSLVTQPPVHYVVTEPGAAGAGVAFLAELAISFLLMWTVLAASNTPRLARYTGLFAGVLVATYISIEAPLSGMSMNPARTFASALPARNGAGLWVYFMAPPLGMLLAGEVYRRWRGPAPIACAKLHHQNNKRCIHCGKPGV